MSMEDNLLCTESVRSIDSNVNEVDDYQQDRHFPTCTYDNSIYSDSRLLDNMVTAQQWSRTSGAYLQPGASNVLPEIRKTVVEWMLSLCDHRHLEDQVFIVAVKLFDTLLSSTILQVNQLQLVACVCLLVACKTRQCTFLSVETLAYYTEDSVTQKEIKQWEILILAKLGWNLCPITTIDFVEPLLYIIPQITSKERVRRNALSYMNMAAIEPEFVGALPSIITAASICLALEIDATDAMAKMASALKCSQGEIQRMRNDLEMAVIRNHQDNAENNNNNNELDDDPFLGESKMSMDSSSRIDGKITPSDISDIQL